MKDLLKEFCMDSSFAPVAPLSTPPKARRGLPSAAAAATVTNAAAAINAAAAVSAQKCLPVSPADDSSLSSLRPRVSNGTAAGKGRAKGAREEFHLGDEASAEDKRWGRVRPMISTSANYTPTIDFHNRCRFEQDLGLKKFLDASMHLYKRFCPSFRPSVRPQSAKIAENKGYLIK